MILFKDVQVMKWRMLNLEAGNWLKTCKNVVDKECKNVADKELKI